MSDITYRAHYEALAVSDLANPILGLDYLHYQALNLMSYIRGVKGVDALDIGCGRGTLTKMLYDRGYRVTAVDISPAYLAQLPEKVRKVQEDADNLPFSSEFDLVVSTDVMEHTLRPGGFIYSVNRALRMGGLACIRVPYRENLLAYAAQNGCQHEFVHLRNYNKPLLRDIFTGSGLSIERFHLDGFSLGTPQPWFVNTRLGNRYNRWAEWQKRRMSAAKVTMWPAWFARLLMRPQEIVVCARKVRAL